MPANKSALIRYKILDECLRQRGRDWTLEQLTVHVSEYLVDELGYAKGISKSSIEKDLRHMKSSEGYMAPIETEKTPAGHVYYYTDAHFSISNSPLDRDDAGKLKAAIQLLKQFEHLPQFKDLEEMLLKLESKTVVNRENVQQLIQFETNNLAEGNRYLRELYKHLSSKSALKIRYKPFGKEPFMCIISPYLLKEYNNRWFLFGKNHQNKYIQNLACDRIEHIEKEPVAFINAPEFKPDTYFKDVIGVSVSDRPPEIIRLTFTPDQANYVKTKQLHHSQKILKDNKKHFEIELFLIVNYELKKLIWSFGDSVTVLEPNDLLTRQLRK